LDAISIASTGFCNVGLSPLFPFSIPFTNFLILFVGALS